MSLDLEISWEHARELVDTLQRENDIVRIVDPVTRHVLYWPAESIDESNLPCMECNAVWGRDERCPNCSSLEAVRQMKRVFKVEISDNHAFWVRSRPLIANGQPCVMETVNDVTEGLMIEGSNHEAVSTVISNLNELIITDAMTGLYNRRFLDEFFERVPQLEKAGTRLNISMLDLDEMKLVNDSYGHLAGDAVLKDIAGFLNSSFNVHDNSHEQYVVRYGGDEFIVISVGAETEAFEQEVLRRYASMRRICLYADQEIPFSLSIGFASSDEFGWDASALIDNADQRMYDNKRTRSL